MLLVQPVLWQRRTGFGRHGVIVLEGDSAEMLISGRSPYVQHDFDGYEAAAIEEEF